MGSEVLIGAEKDVLRNFVEERRKTGKTLIAFGEMKGLLVELKKVNSGRDRIPTTIWGCLKRMPETAGFTFGAGNRELTDAEVRLLQVFVSQKREEKKSISYRDAESLVAEMAKETGEKQRHTTTLWNYFKKTAPDLAKIREIKAGQQEKEFSKKMIVPESTAKKVLNEIKPVINFMGKPPEYLAPLEDLLVENAKLKKENTALKTKSSSENVAQLKKDLKQLKGFLAPAKILLQLTCGLRQQAMGLTKKAEELKRKNGTDLNAFLLELEESEFLK